MTLLRRRAAPPDLDARLAGLDQAVALLRPDDPIPVHVLAQATGVAGKVADRRAVGAGRTVVALAGSTGSGKSTLFNAVVGLDLAETGVRRPTTGRPLACVWGGLEEPGVASLLDWLGIPDRYATGRDSDLDPADDHDHALDGLVLIDLPDHDSVVAAHRAQVDRFVALVDLLVWVVDPEKYADAVLHRDYLQRLVTHEGVLLVVLNQVDRLSSDDRDRCLADLRRLLAADGLHQVELLATSARTGEGVGALSARLAEAVGSRRLADARLAADVLAAAQGLQEATGLDAAIPGSSDVGGSAQRLTAGLAMAAGVDGLAAAAAGSARRAGVARTSWPVTAWLSRLRPDPLRRLRLDRAPARQALPAGPAAQPQVVSRTSRPPATASQQAAARGAVREYVEAALAPLPDGWRQVTRDRLIPSAPQLADELDIAVAAADIGVWRPPRWWAAVRGVQVLLLGVALVGFGWLAALWAMQAFLLVQPEPPLVGTVPLPTVLGVGGVLLGLLVGVLGRFGVGITVRRRRRSVHARLTAAVADVGERVIVAPVVAERERASAIAAALAKAAA